MSTFWSVWIIGLTSINLALIIWVLMANRKVAVDDQADPDDVKVTGHVYDGIEEYDNPLPKWWFQMFVITIVFTVIYLIIYPGMGGYKGLPIFDGKTWTSRGELARDQDVARASYVDSFGKYSEMSIEALAIDPKANKMGARLYSNNCAVCHGSDAGGNYGFPDLTDNDWLYGGSPEAIKHTLIHGRQAQGMLAWGEVLGEEGVVNVAEYVMSLGGRDHDVAKAEAGKAVFATCAACHGADGKGSYAAGAPNLTDDIWLYGMGSDAEPGATAKEIRQSIRNGRYGVMPAQKHKLRDDKIHLLTAYVYSLSLAEDME